MREARADIRSRPGLRSDRKVTEGSAGAPQGAAPRVRACPPHPLGGTDAPAWRRRGRDRATGGAAQAPALLRPAPSGRTPSGSARARPSPRGGPRGERARSAAGAGADTWASAGAGRALGPERRTCWQTPRAVPALRPECRASECKGGGDSASRGPWRGGGPSAPWPSCCGACRTRSLSPASSAAAGSSRRRMKAPARTAPARRRARRWRPGLDITPPPAARALRGRPMGCGEPGPRR